TFDHQALFSGILPDFSGVHLGHGQVLRFDARTVALNQEILHGTRALASDPHTRARLLDKILNGATEPLAEIPNLPEKLRPYQREGVAWLLQRAKQLEPALLADEMGLGKTFQTLVFLLHLKEYSEPGPQLIVLPTSLLTNWQRECEMHTPDRKITIYHGGSRQAEPLSTADLVLTTYGIVMRDQETLASIPWQAVILDEAQAIKNVSSQTAEAVFSLKAQYRMALTGTPLENHPGELASIFHFLAPGYCGPPDRYAKVFHPEQPAYKALKLKTAPFMLRRLKKQVATDLPDRQEISLFLPMDAEQKRLYDKIRSQALETNTDGKPNNMAVLTQLLRLRQVACHPGLVDEACLAQASPKLIYLTERLLELNESGQTALVFSQFTSLLKIAKNHLENHDLHCLYLDGATRDRQALVDRFQAGHGDVFLISLKAGGTGLNLTRANYVFHLDPWWNPMVEAQATDRTHRIGQTQTVFSYKLVSAESIEQKVLALQEQKRLLADDLWQTGAWKPSLGELSDLLDL
ncbi:MAG: DEAD/DEAH box helicase, partial [Acidobacteria bacterium]|nr:DEAD/DEAH box helicase [Acidobacteriota bacterium]